MVMCAFLVLSKRVTTNRHQPTSIVPSQLEQQVVDICERVCLTYLEQMDWDGCSVATVANACGEPVLQVTARAGAGFANTPRPSRILTDSETQTRLAECYGLPKFFADLTPEKGKTVLKHKLKRGAEILAAMRRVLWGP